MLFRMAFFIYPLPHFSGTQLGHKSKAGCTDSPLSWFSSFQFSCQGSPLTNTRSFRSPFHFVSCDLFVMLFGAVYFELLTLTQNNPPNSIRPLPVVLFKVSIACVISTNCHLVQISLRDTLRYLALFVHFKFFAESEGVFATQRKSM
jgi:hypothetical protein